MASNSTNTAVKSPRDKAAKIKAAVRASRIFPSCPQVCGAGEPCIFSHRCTGAWAVEVVGQLVFALLQLLRSIPAQPGHLPALSTHLPTPPRLCTARTWYLQTKASPAVSSLPPPPFARAYPTIHLLVRPPLESQHSQALSVRNLLALDQLFVLRGCCCLGRKPARPRSTCAASTANIKPTAASQPSPRTPRSRGCSHVSIPQRLLGIP